MPDVKSAQFKPAKQRPTPKPLPAQAFPNLAAARDWERHEHVKRAMELGLTKGEAEAHADQEMNEE